MFSLFHKDGPTLAVHKTGDQTWIGKLDLLAPAAGALFADDDGALAGAAKHALRRLPSDCDALDRGKTLPSSEKGRLVYLVGEDSLGGGCSARALSRMLRRHFPTSSSCHLPTSRCSPTRHRLPAAMAIGLGLRNRRTAIDRLDA